MIAELESALFGWLTTTSWQVALLVVLVFSLQRLFRRVLTPRWQLALWSVVALRLFIPALPAVDGAIIRGDWPDRLWSVADRAQDRAPGAWDAGGPRDFLGIRPAARRGAATGKATPSAELDAPAASSIAGGEPERPRGSARSGGGGLSEVFAVTVSSAPVEPTRDLRGSTIAPASGEAVSAAPFVVRVWLCIAAILLAGLIGFELRFRRRVGGSRSVVDPEILEEFTLLRRLSGVRRDVDMRVMKGLGSPAVTGIFRPVLLLPEGALEEFTPEERRCVFLHELAHVGRNDILWNAILGVLQCLWWFHPFVHFAFSRLRQCRESARDFEALHLGPKDNDRAVLYARTLLKLVDHRPDGRRLVPALGFLDGGSDMKRRILMITEYPDHNRRRGVFLGASVLALAGWAGFTQASPPEVLLPEATNGARRIQGSGLQKILVERQSEAPLWRAKLSARLDEARIEGLDLVDVPVDEALRIVSEATGITIVLTEGAMDQLYGDGFEIAVTTGPMTVREALDLITAMHSDLDWCLSREVVAVGMENELPEAMDVRFYNIEPFFREFPEVGPEDVINIGRELSENSSRVLWDREGSYAECFNGLLVVRQTDRAHRVFLDVLELTLNRGRRAETEPPEWRDEIARAMATPIDQVRFDDWTLQDVADWAENVANVPVVIDDPERGGQYGEINLSLSNVTFAAALDWAADRFECRVHVVDGMIRFGDAGEQKTEFFDISDVATTSDGDDASEMVLGMIVDLVDSESWNMDPANLMMIWQGMLVVSQSPENIEQIRAFLDSMRRALRAG